LKIAVTKSLVGLILIVIIFGLTCYVLFFSDYHAREVTVTVTEYKVSTETVQSTVTQTLIITTPHPFECVVIYTMDWEIYQVDYVSVRDLAKSLNTVKELGYSILSVQCR